MNIHQGVPVEEISARDNELFQRARNVLIGRIGDEDREAAFLRETLVWSEKIEAACSENSIVPAGAGEPFMDAYIHLLSVGLIPQGYEERIIRLVSSLRQLDQLVASYFGQHMPDGLRINALCRASMAAAIAADLIDDLELTEDNSTKVSDELRNDGT
jgi:hypothetical protein